jgi:DNA-binding NarL/FixJ family response regulator
MPTALICSPTESVRERLRDQLAQTGYAIEQAAHPGEIYQLLKHAPCDVIVMESRRDNFAGLMRHIFQVNPRIIVHFFFEKTVFCFYPMREQPARLLKAIKLAGLTIAPRMLLHTRTGQRREPAPEVVEI